MESVGPSTVEWVATIVFALAILHTFSVGIFHRLAGKYAEGSVGENFFHLLGEVEIVFGFWALVLVLAWIPIQGSEWAIQKVESLNFTEPLFVFAIMTVAATRPVLDLAQSLLTAWPRYAYLTCLIIGPLLGSLITEPAAMTVTALVLKNVFYDRKVSSRFMYITLGVLFVNISIGGVLTHFAAPPVLMVAKPWGWDLPFMFSTFGWKAAIAVVLNAVFANFLLRTELNAFRSRPTSGINEATLRKVPVWVKAVHLLFLGLVVLTAHHPVIFIGLLLFFIGFTTITSEYQEELKLKQSLLVAFFLAGLVVLGGPQRWWLAPLITQLTELPLFLGAAALTAFTDNAALTYLGSQVEGVSDSFKYALVAGAVAGGGMTVIANAPNPAGYSILSPSFEPEGIKASSLAAAALVPTLIALICFWFL